MNVNSFDDVIQDESDVESDASHDYRGIPGWNNVGALADLLVSLKGLGISDSQAQVVKHLFGQLMEYDRKPIIFKPRVKSPPRGGGGRFARSKWNRSGHFTTDAMKKYV